MAALNNRQRAPKQNPSRFNWKAAGFSENDISVLFPDKSVTYCEPRGYNRLSGHSP